MVFGILDINTVRFEDEPNGIRSAQSPGMRHLAGYTGGNWRPAMLCKISYGICEAAAFARVPAGILAVQNGTVQCSCIELYYSQV